MLHQFLWRIRLDGSFAIDEFALIERAGNLPSFVLREQGGRRRLDRRQHIGDYLIEQDGGFDLVQHGKQRVDASLRGIGAQDIGA